MSPNDSVDIEIFSLNVFTSVREQRGVVSVLYNQSALYKYVIRVILNRVLGMPVLAVKEEFDKVWNQWAFARSKKKKLVAA